MNFIKLEVQYEFKYFIFKDNNKHPETKVKRLISIYYTEMNILK